MKKRIFYVNNDTTCHQDIYTERNASLGGEVELTETDLEAIYGGLASPIATPQTIVYRIATPQAGASPSATPQAGASPSATPQAGASPSATPQAGASQNPDALSQMQDKLEQQFQAGLLQRILGDQGFSKFLSPTV